MARYCVAPRAGAWIETGTVVVAGDMAVVAPRAGAWIETIMPRNNSISDSSRPARARGLKPGSLDEM